MAVKLILADKIFLSWLTFSFCNNQIPSTLLSMGNGVMILNVLQKQLQMEKKLENFYINHHLSNFPQNARWDSLMVKLSNTPPCII